MTHQQQTDNREDASAPDAKHLRKPYTAPQMLSVEPLEAVAATCNPPAAGFGKSVPVPCGTAGS